MALTKVYSFINSADAFKWEKNPTSFEGSRIGEYTEGFILNRFVDSAGRLNSSIADFPVLFSTEAPNDIAARVGRIEKLEWDGGDPIITFGFDENFRPITQRELRDIQWELDIEDFEFYRTHWAIKQADIERILKNRGFNRPIAVEMEAGGFRVGPVETSQDEQRNTEEAKTESKVFISYAHVDAEHLKRLQVHLSPVRRWTALDVWDDTRIAAGDDWREQIETELEQASAAILLISADFLASEFISENELPPLLIKAEREGTRIIPVILKPCLFTTHPELSKFQAINTPDNSFIGMDENGREALLTKVAKTVMDMVGT